MFSTVGTTYPVLPQTALLYIVLCIDSYGYLSKSGTVSVMFEVGLYLRVQYPNWYMSLRIKPEEGGNLEIVWICISKKAPTKSLKAKKAD